MKYLGYDLNRVAARAAEIFEIGVHDIFIEGKQQKRGKAQESFLFLGVTNWGFHLLNWPGVFESVFPELDIRWSGAR